MNLKQYLIDEITKNGTEITARNRTTKELVCYSFTVKTFDYILDNKQEGYVCRKIRKYYSQIYFAIRKLTRDKYSRRAIIMFDVIKTVPECVALVQFLIRDECLNVIVTSRSLDVKRMLDVDIETIKRMSDIVMKELKLKSRIIKFNVNSLHFYT